MGDRHTNHFFHSPSPFCSTFKVFNFIFHYSQIFWFNLNNIDKGNVDAWNNLFSEPCVLVTSVVHQSGEGNLAKLHRLSRNPFPRVASLQMKLLSIVNIFGIVLNGKTSDSETGIADFLVVVSPAGYHYVCNRYYIG